MDRNKLPREKMNHKVLFFTLIIISAMLSGCIGNWVYGQI